MLQVSGWLADRFGVRNIFFCAILLFSLGSLLCALAATLDQLVLSRVVQGIGNAMMVPVGRLTLKELPDELASSGNSLLSMIMQLSISIGVTMAGLLLGGCICSGERG